MPSSRSLGFYRRSCVGQLNALNCWTKYAVVGEGRPVLKGEGEHSSSKCAEAEAPLLCLTGSSELSAVCLQKEWPLVTSLDLTTKILATLLI